MYGIVVCHIPYIIQNKFKKMTNTGHVWSSINRKRPRWPPFDLLLTAQATL